jgi:hypothetical protein
MVWAADVAVGVVVAVAFGAAAPEVVEVRFTAATAVVAVGVVPR